MVIQPRDLVFLAAGVGIGVLLQLLLARVSRKMGPPPQAIPACGSRSDDADVAIAIAAAAARAGLSAPGDAAVAVALAAVAARAGLSSPDDAAVAVALAAVAGRR